MSGHGSKDIALLVDALAEAQEALAKAKIEQGHANRTYVQAQDAVQRIKNRILDALDQWGISP